MLAAGGGRGGVGATCLEGGQGRSSSLACLPLSFTPPNTLAVPPSLPPCTCTHHRSPLTAAAPPTPPLPAPPRLACLPGSGPAPASASASASAPATWRGCAHNRAEEDVQAEQETGRVHRQSLRACSARALAALVATRFLFLAATHLKVRDLKGCASAVWSIGGKVSFGASASAARMAS